VSADDELIERARMGDASAWRELYESLSGRLVLWLRTRPSGDPAAAPEDIAAEAWLVAADKLADFRGNVNDFAGWLFGIARNCALNAARRTQRRATDATEILELDHPTDTHELIITGEDWVRHALAQLPLREGEVLSAMEVVGLDTSSTATVLGISTTSVRVARHRGLARLRKSHPELS
jgi:RNA polymerase sigma-70 factor (ECF subfamily)